ncbi:unnamed protein product [Parajaminaea phylloscopi]
MARLALRPIYILVFIALLALYTFVTGRIGASPGKGSRSPWSFVQSRPDVSTPPFIPPKPAAGFVILCRTSDLGDLLPTLTNLEQTFNAHPYNSYPYVLLNDAEFTPFFKSKVETLLAELRQRFGGHAAPSPEVRWGTIPQDHWEPPKWIDWAKAHRYWKVYIQQKIPYADSLTYRSMCRWQSGFFFKHSLLADLEFYWRIEPSTRFTCNMVPPNGQQPRSWDKDATGHGDFYDPFRWMKANNKKYGWVLSLKEYYPTIRTLWPKSRAWLMKHPEYHASNNTGLSMILKEDKIGYNLCHFWSNFEIASLDFFRSKGYQAYFEYLDSTGMFYYERTGDAPVHTIAATWMLNGDEIHQFENIGYYHAPFHACPQGQQFKGRCSCDPHQSFQYDISGYSCQKEWDTVTGKNSTEAITSYNVELGLNVTDFRVLDIPHG